MKRQLVLALCAACAVALLWIAAPGEPGGDTPPSPGSGTPVEAPMAAAAPEADGEEQPPRSEMPAIAPAVADALAPHRFALEIHTRDEDDLPVPGAPIWIAPAHHELNGAVAGGDGVLRLSWRGRVPRMVMVFGSGDDLSGGRLLRRLEVTAGTTAIAPLRLKRQSRRRDSVVLLDGQGGQSWISSSQRPAVPPVEIDDEGTAWFVTRSDVADEPPGTVNEVFDDVVFFQVQLAHGLERVAAPGEEHAVTTGSVAGVVRDARGGPAVDVLVQVGSDRDRPSPWWARTDRDGGFRIGDVPAGPMQLRAGGGEHGLAFAAIEILAGQEVTWLGRLDRGLELTGRLVDDHGRGLAAWRIEARPCGETGPWIDGTTAFEDGSFGLPNVTNRPYALRMRRLGAIAHAWRVESVWPGVDEVITVPGAELGTGELRVQPVRPDGAPAAAVELRLWLDGLDEGVRSPSTDAARPRAVDFLGPAPYTVTAGGPGIAHRDVARVHVGAGSPTDLGSVAVPERCVLGLPEGLEVGEDEFALLRLHEAVLSRAGALSGDRRHLVLPPGEYLVRDGDADREIDLGPGANTFEPRRESR